MYFIDLVKQYETLVKEKSFTPPVKKYNIVYRTTNLINGRYYVGRHSTDVLDDGYLGSGVAFGHAVKKYGSINFKREILFHAFDYLSMCAAESLLADRSVVSDPLSYNAAEGGLFFSFKKLSGHAKNKHKIRVIRSMSFGDVRLKLRENALRCWQSPAYRSFHKERTKLAVNRPEVRQNHLSSINSPSVCKKRNQIMKSPEYISKQRSGLKKALSTPEAKRVKSAASKKLWLDPAYVGTQKQVGILSEKCRETSRLNLVKIRDNVEIQTRRVASLKQTLNRPWKLPVSRSRPEVMRLYLNLDKIYKMHLDADFSHRGGLKLFEDRVLLSFGKKPTAGVYSYFSNIGDPLGDPEWVILMNERPDNA